MSTSPTKLSGPRKLFGRDPDLALLDDAWQSHQLKVVTIVAWGGVGKTALVNEWRNRLCEREGGPEFVFDWSFASQGVRERGAVSADPFLREALRFFGEVEYAESNASPLDKGTRLAAIVGERRALLILDGVEPLQAPPQGAGSSCALREGSIANLLRCLAARNRGLCIVTTREPVHDLEGFESTTVRRLNLAHLSEEAGAELLASLLAEGERPKPVVSTRAERAEISVAVEGHALTLQLLGVYIRHALGDIRRWREIDFGRADEEQGGFAFRVMAAYVTWLSGAGIREQRQLALLRLFGFFDRPADPGCIAALLEAPAIPGVTEALVGLDAQGWTSLTSSLAQMRLVTQRDYDAPPVSGYDEAAALEAGEEGRPSGEPTRQRPRDFGYQAQVLDAHPLVREFFARELRRTSDQGWRAGHRRLYEHLCESVPYWPEEVAGLQPLYQAILHGCAAGRIRDACARVYRDRILRGARFYSTHQLGAISADLAAIACFFERMWDRPSTDLGEAARSWMLGEAASRLHALGRLSGAFGPMRASLEMDVKSEDWNNAARAASNLSELELTLGQTGAAVEDARQSVKHADRSTDDFLRIIMRTILGAAQHHAGNHASARGLFEQAEAMQAQYDPTEPRLYSLQGYRYCDLLLSPAERAAWRGALGDTTHDREFVTLCDEVFVRATQTLTVARRNHWILDIAMDQLTCGRAALYAATLTAQPPTRTTTEPELSFATAREHLDAAVDGLRNAGQLNYLPRGLITRAWLYHRERPDLARADLDDAWALAERGPMPLLQADIQLTRARLFHDCSALAHARMLITRHGYGRRHEELTDTEHAALAWPALQPPPAPKQSSPRIKPMSTPPWDLTQRPDIAILIALPEELRILANDYSDQWYPQANPNYLGSDFHFLGPRDYRCTATIMPRMGPTVASQVSMRLLAMRPSTIINIGIAGGFKNDDLRIGDVIVPRQVDAYDETGKIDGVRWLRRGSDYRPSASLLAEVQELEFTARVEHARWLKDGSDQMNQLRMGPDRAAIEKLVNARLLRDQPIVSTNHLASGSFVVASKPFAEFIREANADIHAGEMEAAGMMAAAEYQREQVDTLVVRGISDHVNADKSEVDAVGEGALRRLAMANSWRLVCTLMRLGLLRRSAVPGPSAGP